MNIFRKLFSNEKKSAKEVVTSEVDRSSAENRPIPDVNQPVENPRLKELLSKWQENKTEENMSNVFEEIVLRAWFLCVFESSDMPRNEEGGKFVLQKDAVLNFPMLQGADGAMFHPVFTDGEELGRWQGVSMPPKTVIVSFDDLHSMIAENDKMEGVVVNPFGASFVIAREGMQSLKERKELAEKGVALHKIEKKTSVILGDPKDYPEKMVKAISEHVRNHPEVSKVWLRWMIRGNEQSFLIVVDFAGETQDIFGGIADAAKPFLDEIFLDMVPFSDSFGQQATEGVEPFYIR